MKVIINAETKEQFRVPLSAEDLAYIEEKEIIKAAEDAQKLIDEAANAQFKTDIAAKLNITEEELSKLKDIL